MLRRCMKGGGLSEAASCKYHTESMTAVPGYDYEEAEGTLEFEAGETRQLINLQILPNTGRERPRDFLIVLEEAEGGPSFDPDADGGSEEAILTVFLEPRRPKAGAVDSCLGAVVSVDHLRLAVSAWPEQFWSAIYCNGSSEEQKEASALDWVMHLIALPWKVSFALMPPVCLGGGWVCFVASLIGIAFLTACVSDLAEMFGCVLGVPDIITAITFVALGTSMPDLFASISAAKEDPTADASIVNVTGSNSVNVFLGLGVPWTLAAVFWMKEGRTKEWELRYPEAAARMVGGGFVVEAQNLGFCVYTFCFMCVLALLVLHLRRKWLKAELGGPMASKIATVGALLVYWAAWVALVSGQVLRWSQPGASEAEFTAVFALAIAICLVVTAISMVTMRKDRETILQEEAAAAAAAGPRLVLLAGEAAKVAEGATAPAAAPAVPEVSTAPAASKARGGQTCGCFKQILMGKPGGCALEIS